MATYIKKDFASPNGPILLLSAKGSTTASIAQANGVKDFSGNGNHGQAYGGVTVVNNADLGDCFSFDGTAVKKITFSNTYPISTNAITLAVKIRHLGRGGGSDGYNAIFGNNMVLCYSPAGSICLQLKNNNGVGVYRIDTANNATLVDGNIHFLIGIMYIENNVCYFQTYVDGVLQSPARTSGSSSQSSLFNGLGSILIGELTTSSSYKSNIQLSDIRIYPRVLSAAEVKYLYNGFQPNIIVGQSIPSGAILDLSARGLTTAGIAQANGVVDRSGNGNHGQAYNGVAVVNDDEMGSCFSFSTTNNIHIECPLVNTSINTDSFTFSFKYKRTGIITTGNQLLFSAANSSNVAKFSLYCLTRTNYTNDNANVITVNMYTNNSNALEFNLETLGKKTLDVHVYALTYNHTIDELKIYLDGILVATQSFSHQDNFEMTKFLIGYVSSYVYHPVGLMTDIRAYNRCLNASEVQQLADASLKKITNIKSGSSDVRQIFSNGEMIYAKTNDYSLNL